MLSFEIEQKSQQFQSSRLRNQPRKDHKVFISQSKILKTKEFENFFHTQLIAC